MKINILSIGNFKVKDDYKALFNEYKKRIKWNINLIELKNSQIKEKGERKKQEEKEILKYLPKEFKTIILDERGEIITTMDFVNIFTQFIENSNGINFVIGGSDGLTQEIREKADFILSFGKMVHPHLMIRIMLIEQIYRIYTIKNNHPYHK